jgi:sterol desaturase/sphingolipid hydroxylase (fatty acid hydroxylase superfamily)
MVMQIIYWAVAIMVFFTLIEFLHSWKEKKNLYRKNSLLINLLIGTGTFVSSFINRIFVLSALELVFQLRLFTFGNSVSVWIIVFFLNDLSYYLYHRCSHEINWFWASHVVHHSSTEYNLGLAFRLPWTSQITGQFLFWLWMPLLGFDPLIVYACYNIGLFYQFWLHTETIKKLPVIIEFIFNTPSHHRVHHGSDLKYIDKNHGGILIIWDRLFGTFQAENEHPVYGLTSGVEYSNPLHIAISGWTELYKRIVSSPSLAHTIKYLLKPPGWSHDGSTRTAQQMKDEYNRLHRDSPIH